LGGPGAITAPGSWSRRLPLSTSVADAPTVTSDQLTCVVSGRPADDHAHRPADDLPDYRPV
jgi:hypothetical protein